MKAKPVSDLNSRSVEEIIIPNYKKRRNTKRIKKGVIKMKHHKISKSLTD